jgi:hypothetical protein
MTVREKILYAGALLIVLLALLILWPAVMADQTDARKGGGQEKSASIPSLPDMPFRDTGNFTAVGERPLFITTRRMPVIEEDVKVNGVPASETTSLSFSVVGIIIGEGKKLASFERTGKKESVTLPIGQSIDGWTIDGIDFDSVSLKSGNRSKILRLADDGKINPVKHRPHRSSKNEK